MRDDAYAFVNYIGSLVLYKTMDLFLYAHKSEAGSPDEGRETGRRQGAGAKAGRQAGRGLIKNYLLVLILQRSGQDPVRPNPILLKLLQDIIRYLRLDRNSVRAGDKSLCSTEEKRKSKQEKQEKKKTQKVSNTPPGATNKRTRQTDSTGDVRTRCHLATQLCFGVKRA